MEYPSELIKFLKNKFRLITWRVYKIEETYYISADDKEFLKSNTFLSVWKNTIVKIFYVDEFIPIIHNSEAILQRYKPLVEYKSKKK
jgi:hypothetical protein